MMVDECQGYSGRGRGSGSGRECMGLSKIMSAMVYETVVKARDGG